MEYKKIINTALSKNQHADTHKLEGNWSNYGKVNLGAAFTFMCKLAHSKTWDEKAHSTLHISICFHTQITSCTGLWCDRDDAVGKLLMPFDL